MKKVRVILYTKPGCHLCDRAKEQMLAANCTELYDFEEVNIESSPDLFVRYGASIPVISINGIEMFEHRVSAAEFREAVQGQR